MIQPTQQRQKREKRDEAQSKRSTQSHSFWQVSLGDSTAKIKLDYYLINK